MTVKPSNRKGSTFLAINKHGGDRSSEEEGTTADNMDNNYNYNLEPVEEKEDESSDIKEEETGSVNDKDDNTESEDEDF